MSYKGGWGTCFILSLISDKRKDQGISQWPWRATIVCDICRHNPPDLPQLSSMQLIAMTSAAQGGWGG